MFLYVWVWQVPGPNNVVVLEDPSTHFMRLWNNLGNGQEPVEFFSNYDHYGMFKFANFSNPQTFDLFGIRLPSRDQIESMKQMLEKEFLMVVIANRLEESLVVLRRRLCWTFKDAISVHPGVPKLKPNGVFARVRKFNGVDQELFEHFSKRLEDLLGHDDGALEAEQLKHYSSLARTKCQAQFKSKVQGGLGADTVAGANDSESGRQHLAWGKTHMPWFASSLRAQDVFGKGECHAQALTPAHFRAMHRSAAQVQAGNT